MVDPEDLERTILDTQADLATVSRTIGTLIAWIVQSANRPLNVADAQRLIDMLPPKK